MLQNPGPNTSDLYMLSFRLKSMTTESPVCMGILRSIVQGPKSPQFLFVTFMATNLYSSSKNGNYVASHNEKLLYERTCLLFF